MDDYNQQIKEALRELFIASRKRHNEFSHDFNKYAKKCPICKMHKRIAKLIHPSDQSSIP